MSGMPWARDPAFGHMQPCCRVSSSTEYTGCLDTEQPAGRSLVASWGVGAGRSCAESQVLLLSVV